LAYILWQPYPEWLESYTEWQLHPEGMGPVLSSAEGMVRDGKIKAGSDCTSQVIILFAVFCKKI
jgi:hypothetical protein